MDRPNDTRPRVERLDDEHIEAALARITMLARTMDSIIAVPGTRVRLGLDAVIGLVPVVGDLISQAVSTYIIWEARQLGVSKFTMARMFANSLVDTIFGAIPIAGDVFDVAFRANMKNLRILQKHLEKRGYRPPSERPIIEAEYRRVA
jgi:Domain of unknown function (DUF4112)